MVAKGHVCHETVIKEPHRSDKAVLSCRGGEDENLLKYTLFKITFLETCSISSVVECLSSMP